MELEPWHRGLTLLVAVDGYEISPRREVENLQLKGEPADFLIPKTQRPAREVRGINTNLYRTIAEDLSVETILALAGKYGPLKPVYTVPARGRGEVIVSDALRGWLELWRLRVAVRLFDLAQEGNRSALAQIVKLKDRNRATFEIRRNKDKFQLLPKGLPEEMQSRGGREEWRWHRDTIVGPLEADDVAVAALTFVRQQINEKLSGVSPRVIYPDTGEHKLMLRPANLEAALWLQFAEAVVRNKPMKQCEYCNKWFEPMRSDQRLCSPTCRIKKHRREKNQQRHSGVDQ
jgi:hypothetical protein